MNKGKSTRHYSSKQERGVAKQLGGKQVANSGATAFHKGDVKTADGLFLIECKTSTADKQSVSIKKEWLTKLEEERFAMGNQEMALAFNFGPNQKNYYVVTEKLFQFLYSKLKEELEQCES